MFLTCSLQVYDSWEPSPSKVSVVAAAAPEVVAAPPPAVIVDGVTAVAEAPVLPVAPAAVASVSAAAGDTNGASTHRSELPSAVSTVENVQLEEQPAPGFQATAATTAANNIVQAPPMGAVPVGAVDPITEYEEADKYQVLEVGPGHNGATATATAPTAKPAARSMDSLTVSELKTELKRRGMSSFGSRRELINRLQGAGAL
ncbi:hypothetical protein GPECTOR_30g280 [Gonium pectorale]|uniref:SAP domain-containing protein n=1 Tax=Gonium pectorale TaxID=33097 RepID=A0A150GEC4_GONPE|nr:hypothetical protein GPECTOR_30g280 [Gonium pectorale]|eukprot:KXZ48184.1 hypothetical protein GPECTOR_30g280 [Gonium pectorale]